MQRRVRFSSLGAVAAMLMFVATNDAHALGFRAGGFRAGGIRGGAIRGGGVRVGGVRAAGVRVGGVCGVYAPGVLGADPYGYPADTNPYGAPYVAPGVYHAGGIRVGGFREGGIHAGGFRAGGFRRR